jgi:ATP-dependent DNA ligase
VPANGTTDFSVLQNELRGKSTKIVMVAFDLLYLNGYDFRKLPLIERKALLKEIIFEVAGREMYQHASITASTKRPPKDLQARLKALIRKTQTYSKKIAHRGIWVEPSLLAEIEYRAKSAEGKVRHPFFKGIREDL